MERGQVRQVGGHARLLQQSARQRRVWLSFLYQVAGQEFLGSHAQYPWATPGSLRETQNQGAGRDAFHSPLHLEETEAVGE